MQASENGSDVIPCPDSSDKSGGGVLDSLNNYNNNTQLVTRHMSVNAYSYIYERTESQARTGGLSVTVGFIVQMSFKLFLKWID